MKPTDAGDYFDEDVRGFCLRVAPSGRKTFCVFYQIGRHLRRFTLGIFPLKSLADARDEAQDAPGAASKGHDPALQKKAKRAAGTVEELVDLYVEEYASKRRSGRETKRIWTPSGSWPQFFIGRFFYLRRRFV